MAVLAPLLLSGVGGYVAVLVLFDFGSGMSDESSALRFEAVVLAIVWLSGVGADAAADRVGRLVAGLPEAAVLLVVSRVPAIGNDIQAIGVSVVRTDTCSSGFDISYLNYIMYRAPHLHEQSVPAL